VIALEVGDNDIKSWTEKGNKRAKGPWVGTWGHTEPRSAEANSRWTLVPRKFAITSTKRGEGNSTGPC